MTTEVLEILTKGEIEISGRLIDASNATLFGSVNFNKEALPIVYKPIAGERPLWDFPSGLYKREVAAYELSEAMGLHLVPTTVLRDGPFGVGSVQWFVEADFREHYFTLHETRPDLHDQFRSMAVFDFVANNTDRKSGHCLVDANQRIWGIDNGLCFAADFKLRTVIWEFAGEPLGDRLRAALEPLIENVPLRVAGLLDSDEVEALSERAAELITTGELPVDHTGRRYPWPLV